MNSTHMKAEELCELIADHNKWTWNSAKDAKKGFSVENEETKKLTAVGSRPIAELGSKSAVKLVL